MHISMEFISPDYTTPYMNDATSFKQFSLTVMFFKEKYFQHAMLSVADRSIDQIQVTSNCRLPQSQNKTILTKVFFI